ncbi:hypothetical protein BJ508DRAFT_16329 [Ascobolus immersus RN42]|uniref:Uncharacterized protein n=1 Tax=Ascobolus immersus RN42 TaxID=1160509 RepID=A0A3N4HPY4_ASCIM|nr:hypothetical protein BJ508DRAFT_16329 [Ascobolus immersus RN42]
MSYNNDHKTLAMEPDTASVFSKADTLTNDDNKPLVSRDSIDDPDSTERPSHSDTKETVKKNWALTAIGSIGAGLLFVGGMLL